MHTAEYWIKQLHLLPHPEGGFYKEIYRAEGHIPQAVLPEGFYGPRSYATSIYFLLEKDNFSAFHRIPSDEIWHFYAGDALEVHVINADRRHEIIQLGNEPDKGQALQAIVPAGCWFGSQLKQGGSYALVGCTVAPGFDFQDFEMAERNTLLKDYPQHAQIIKALTRT